MIVDTVSESVRALHKIAAESLPAAGVGIIQKDSQEHTILTYVDAFGLIETPKPFAAFPPIVWAACQKR
jgi:hypothetical protein